MELFASSRLNGKKISTCAGAKVKTAVHFVDITAAAHQWGPLKLADVVWSHSQPHPHLIFRLQAIKPLSQELGHFCAPFGHHRKRREQFKFNDQTRCMQVAGPAAYAVHHLGVLPQDFGHRRGGELHHRKREIQFGID